MKGKATGSCMALDRLGTSFLVPMASHVKWEPSDAGDGPESYRISLILA